MFYFAKNSNPWYIKDRRKIVTKVNDNISIPQYKTDVGFLIFFTNYLRCALAEGSSEKLTYNREKLKYFPFKNYAFKTNNPHNHKQIYEHIYNPNTNTHDI